MQNTMILANVDTDVSFDKLAPAKAKTKDLEALCVLFDRLVFYDNDFPVTISSGHAINGLNLDADGCAAMTVT